jgi:hypothetical protein
MSEIQDDQLFLEIFAALKHIRPDGDYTLVGTDYANIEWRGGGVLPSLEEIDAAREELADQFPWRTFPDPPQE